MANVALLRLPLEWLNVKDHVAVEEEKKKKCMETPLARHQSATQVNSEFQIIKNIEDLKESGGFRKIAGQRVVRMEVLALTYLLLGAGLNGKKLR